LTVDQLIPRSFRELAQDPEFKAMQAVDTEKQNTESAAKVENTTETPKEPEVQVKPGSDFKFTPIKFDAPAETTSAKDTAAKSEAEKRLERAKRFGVPVKEEVKKELRAQKFSSNTSPAEEKSPSPVAKHVEVRDKTGSCNFLELGPNLCTLDR
jgi:SAP domain-containing ribonucleoprotein